MLLDDVTLEGITSGRIRVVFRTWRRPTVKAGGTLRTRRGVLAIEAVEAIVPGDITSDDVEGAGFRERAELLSCLQGREGVLYRIRVRLAGEDPRVALRRKRVGRAELEELAARLRRMDEASPGGSWTREYLEVIRERPGQRAPDLAAMFGLETLPFKQRVRKLKELGLTESLEVGYRLSPRGRSYLEGLQLAAAKGASKQQPAAAGARKAAGRRPGASKPARKRSGSRVK
jgi:hypothetical protein